MARGRGGFTLIELMVSMALTLFIMVILSQAFILALDIFSGLKGIGDLQLNLRTAATMLRSDLGGYHFEGSRRVSDSDIATNPPRQGFFMVYQGKPSSVFVGGTRVTNVSPAVGVLPNTYEGMDPDGVPSHMAVNHILYFTSRLQGNGYEDFYRAAITDPTFGNAFLADYPLTLPNNVAADATVTPLPAVVTDAPAFGSSWGEICYYLLQTGTTTEPDNPSSTLGTPLYGLYRAMYVVPTNTSVLNYKPNAAPYYYTPPSITYFQGISCNISAALPAVDFYSPDDLANAQQLLIGPAGPVGLRSTRTLPMISNVDPNIKAPTYKTPMPLVPPSLKWVIPASGAPGPQLVPLFASNDPVASTQPRGGLQVLPNVLSFHVQIMPRPDPRFTTVPYWTDPEMQPWTFDKLQPSIDPNNPNEWSGVPRRYDTGAYYDPNSLTQVKPLTQPPITTPVPSPLPAWWDAPPAGPGPPSPPFPGFPTYTWAYPFYLYGPQPHSLMAVRITLRVWDPRSQQARQITLVQDL